MHDDYEPHHSDERPMEAMADRATDPTRGHRVWVIYDTEHGAFLRCGLDGSVRWTAVREAATEFEVPYLADEVRRGLLSGSAHTSVQETTRYPRVPNAPKAT